MNSTKDTKPMRIHLSEERKKDLIRTLQGFYSENFDEDLSLFRAERLLDFFVKLLGPPLYNQAIQDARGFMLEKLDDLDAEFYEKEDID